MISILPLRKNSKRIKNKNKKIINGKHLYEFILDELLKSKQIKKIIITTDYKLNIKNSKILLHKRPLSLRGNCNMNLVIKDVLENYEGDQFIQVHATNPCLKYVTIDKAIKYFRKNKKKYDSIFSVNDFKKRLWNKNLVPYNHKIKESPTTQNLKKLYEENSCFYIFSRKSFIKNQNRIGKKPQIFKTNKIESIDVDYEDDLKFVRMVKKYV